MNMIAIDSDDEDEEDKMLAGFIPSYLDSEMDSFRDSHVSKCITPWSEDMHLTVLCFGE